MARLNDIETDTQLVTFQWKKSCAVRYSWPIDNLTFPLNANRFITRISYTQHGRSLITNPTFLMASNQLRSHPPVCAIPARAIWKIFKKKKITLVASAKFDRWGRWEIISVGIQKCKEEEERGVIPPPTVVYTNTLQGSPARLFKESCVVVHVLVTCL